MKKSDIAVDFIINQSDETSPQQLESRNNYSISSPKKSKASSPSKTPAERRKKVIEK